MTKNMSLLILISGIFLVILFYFAIDWFHHNPNWQDSNAIFARKVLGKGFKIALNGQDWNSNHIPECIAFVPEKKLQKNAPHLVPLQKLVVLEKDTVLFSWSSKDTFAFIPYLNSPKKPFIPILFSQKLDSINFKDTFYLKYFSSQFQIISK
jgi:hypothetical protein